MSIAKSLAQSIARNVAQSVAMADGGASTPTLQHIPLYGQSLSLGADPLFVGTHGVDNVKSSASAIHKMLDVGVRIVADSAGISNANSPVPPDEIASLVALAEQGNPNTSYPSYTIYGETMASGFGIKATRPTIFSCAGRGAYPVASLSRSTSAFVDNWHYANTIASVIAARELAVAAGYTYSVPCIIWKHGEADAGANTARATYKTRVLQLIDDLRTDISNSGLIDASSLYFLTDQMGYQQTSTSYSSISTAMAEMHRESGGKLILVGPGYPQTFTATNDVHLNATGYRLRGEMFGKVQAIIDGGSSWTPCLITGVSRSTTTITVTIHVPNPPLVVDTSLVATVANKGFTYSGATITDVSITDTGAGDNTGVITITIDSDAGGTLGVGYDNGTNLRAGASEGPRTNIRDSDSTTADYDSSALYNWLCTDQWTVA